MRVDVAEGVREVRGAARRLLRAPGFTTGAVLALGVGIGATAAIFTLLDAIVLRPLPYPSPERLVVVHQTMTNDGASGVAWPLTPHTYLHFKDRTRVFEAVGGYRDPFMLTLTGAGGTAERVAGVHVTAELLDVLGARAELGRLFGSDEDAPDLVVLGHGLWERRFGSEPSIVGATVVLDGEARQVVGVMAPNTRLPTRDVDLWLPERIDPAALPTDEFRIRTVARLAPGADLDDAARELGQLTQQLPEVAPFFSIYLEQFGLRTHVRPLAEEVVGDVARILWILLGAVGIVLLVAMANVANLFLVRSESRRREIAVRSALGARRGHLLSHFTAESTLVAAAAGVVGVGLAMLSVQVLVSLSPPSIPRLAETGVGGGTLVLVALLCLAVALALGIYPYARFGRTSGTLSDRGSRGGGAEAAVGDALVVAQVALALVLLSGAALLLRSFQNLTGVDMGFEARGVVTAEVSLSPAEYASHDEVLAFVQTLRERALGIPGVRAVALGPAPLGMGGGCSGLHVEGMTLAAGEFPPCAAVTRVGADYFDLLDVSVTAGRGLDEADVSDRAAVAVVSETLARRLWRGEDPVGKGVRPAPRSGPPWYRIVGVVEDVRREGPHGPPAELIFFPPVMALDPWGPLRTVPLLVSLAPEAGRDAPAALRRLVAEIDPDVPVTIGSLEEDVSRSMVRIAFALFLLGAAAATALIIGVVGLYGVIAYRVGRRRSEIGIRMAMGAARAQVRGLVLRHSLRLLGIGSCLGIVGAFLLTRSLGSLLYGVRPGEPWVLAAAAALLAGTAIAATWIPAQRATRVDPVECLRAD